MNWRFISKWVITFTVATIVYTLTGRFWMALGFMILLAVAYSYVLDFIDKRKGKQEQDNASTPETL